MPWGWMRWSGCSVWPRWTSRSGPAPRSYGINNRDLATLEEVDTETAHRLRPAIPAGVISVAESGITSREEVARLERDGVDAILVGETLMRAGDPVRTVAELLGR